MITEQTTFGYIPLCTPKTGKPWFAGNVVIGYTAADARAAFVELCGYTWDELKKEGWRIVRVKISTAQ